ncbi:hypothetical protein EEL33_04435 [Muribaculaceae bacterium Isolate-037 (Harlan)]|nr:hypothetical protein EEL33_04435 [Muribaculaceae bacterium Isolate-037 (Harlan)]
MVFSVSEAMGYHPATLWCEEHPQSGIVSIEIMTGLSFIFCYIYNIDSQTMDMLQSQRTKFIIIAFYMSERFFLNFRVNLFVVMEKSG